MKKILILIIAAVALISCNGSTDQNVCMQSVKNTFPNAHIYYSPSYRDKYTFVVVDSSGNIFLVKTMGLSSSDITSISVLLESK